MTSPRVAACGQAAASLFSLIASCQLHGIPVELAQEVCPICRGRGGESGHLSKRAIRALARRKETRLQVFQRLGDTTALSVNLGGKLGG